jgi:prepilin-type N-terminal cleavage/methylation domain-containing protein
VLERTFKLIRGQPGVTLIEMAVALGILGFLIPVFLFSISTGFTAVKVTDEGTQAEALARTQLEAIKGSAYLSCDPTPCYSNITGLPPQYSLSVDVQALDTPTCATDGNCNTLQKVTVSVFRPGDGGNKLIFQISAYKVKQ